MKKILLVEDEKSTSDIYSQVLKEAGFEVTVADDGQKGLDFAKAGGWDLILLDVMLPKLDGLAILTELVKSPPTVANKKIILLTNLSLDPVVKEALSLGASEAIVKSDTDPGKLLEKVKNLTT